MTDATDMLRTLTDFTKQFITAQQQMQQMADRIASDSSLSTKL